MTARNRDKSEVQLDKVSLILENLKALRIKSSPYKWLLNEEEIVEEFPAFEFY